LGEKPDLVFVFFSIKHDANVIVSEIARRRGSSTVLGACAESVIGGAIEIEGDFALSVWMARLPGTSVDTLRLSYSASIDQGSFVGWTESLLEMWPAGSVLILFGEPFTFPADRFAALLNDEQPGVPLVGGMASGGDGPGSHHLILNDELLHDGAVAVRLHGSVRSKTIVSQGCSPIGQPFVITKADRNVIHELGGKPALVQLHAIHETLSPGEQQKAQRGIHVGRVIDEYKEQFERGDFLVRNVLGADRASGALAVGDHVRAGQTIQFHLRDAQSADEELRRLFMDVPASPPWAGSLVFTCNGRGTRLFEEPNHDAAIVSQWMGNGAVSGFFAAGELGPVGGRNFLHGFTASILLLG
jgi:small ligand-binding sensory domain FIST